MDCRLREALFVVDDLDSAIKFYTEKMGFGLEKRFDWGFALLSVDGGPVKLGLMTRDNWAADFSPAHAHCGGMLSLQVADLETERRKLINDHVHVTHISGSKGEHRAFLAEFGEDDHWIFIWEDGSGTLGD